MSDSALAAGGKDDKRNIQNKYQKSWSRTAIVKQSEKQKHLRRERFCDNYCCCCSCFWPCKSCRSEDWKLQNFSQKAKNIIETQQQTVKRRLQDQAEILSDKPGDHQLQQSTGLENHSQAHNAARTTKSDSNLHPNLSPASSCSQSRPSSLSRSSDSSSASSRSSASSSFWCQSSSTSNRHHHVLSTSSSSSSSASSSSTSSSLSLNDNDHHYYHSSSGCLRQVSRSYQTIILTSDSQASLGEEERRHSRSSLRCSASVQAVGKHHYYHKCPAHDCSNPYNHWASAQMDAVAHSFPSLCRASSSQVVACVNRRELSQTNYSLSSCQFGAANRHISINDSVQSSDLMVSNENKTTGLCIANKRSISISGLVANGEKICRLHLDGLQRLQSVSNGLKYQQHRELKSFCRCCRHSLRHRRDRCPKWKRREISCASSVGIANKSFSDSIEQDRAQSKRCWPLLPSNHNDKDQHYDDDDDDDNNDDDERIEMGRYCSTCAVRSKSIQCKHHQFSLFSGQSDQRTSQDDRPIKIKTKAKNRNKNELENNLAQKGADQRHQQQPLRACNLRGELVVCSGSSNSLPNDGGVTEVARKEQERVKPAKRNVEEQSDKRRENAIIMHKSDACRLESRVTLQGQLANKRNNSIQSSLDLSGIIQDRLCHGQGFVGGSQGTGGRLVEVLPTKPQLSSIARGQDRFAAVRGDHVRLLPELATTSSQTNVAQKHQGKSRARRVVSSPPNSSLTLNMTMRVGGQFEGDDAEAHKVYEGLRCELDNERYDIVGQPTRASGDFSRQLSSEEPAIGKSQLQSFYKYEFYPIWAQNERPNGQADSTTRLATKAAALALNAAAQASQSFQQQSTQQIDEAQSKLEVSRDGRDEHCIEKDANTNEEQEDEEEEKQNMELRQLAENLAEFAQRNGCLHCHCRHQLLMLVRNEQILNWLTWQVKQDSNGHQSHKAKALEKTASQLRASRSVERFCASSADVAIRRRYASSEDSEGDDDRDSSVSASENENEDNEIEDQNNDEEEEDETELDTEQTQLNEDCYVEEFVGERCKFDNWEGELIRSGPMDARENVDLSLEANFVAKSDGYIAETASINSSKAPSSGTKTSTNVIQNQVHSDNLKTNNRVVAAEATASKHRQRQRRLAVSAASTSTQYDDLDQPQQSASGSLELIMSGFDTSYSNNNDFVGCMSGSAQHRRAVDLEVESGLVWPGDAPVSLRKGLAMKAKRPLERQQRDRDSSSKFSSSFDLLGQTFSSTATTMTTAGTRHDFQQQQQLQLHQSQRPAATGFGGLLQAAAGKKKRRFLASQLTISAIDWTRMQSSSSSPGQQHRALVHDFYRQQMNNPNLIQRRHQLHGAGRIATTTTTTDMSDVRQPSTVMSSGSYQHLNRAESETEKQVRNLRANELSANLRGQKLESKCSSSTLMLFDASPSQQTSATSGSQWDLSSSKKSQILAMNRRQQQQQVRPFRRSAVDAGSRVVISSDGVATNAQLGDKSLATLADQQRALFLNSDLCSKNNSNNYNAMSAMTFDCEGGIESEQQPLANEQQQLLMEKLMLGGQFSMETSTVASGQQQR